MRSDWPNVNAKILTVMVMVVARIVELMEAKEKEMKILTVMVTVVARFVKQAMMRILLTAFVWSMGCAG